MIISHKHKFIFLKTEKTAGTSIEISLSRYCGNKDIITPISDKDEDLRKEFGKYPANYLRPLYLRAFLYLKWRILVGEKPRMERYWNHIPAMNVREEVGEKVWEKYFTFCFIRNPFDEIISRYHWSSYAHGQQGSLDDFVMNYADFNRNNKFFSNGDEIIVDYVARYEDLDLELMKISGIIGIEFDGWLPKAKSQIRSDNRPYEEVLTSNQIEYIKVHSEYILTKYYPELLN